MHPESRRHWGFLLGLVPSFVLIGAPATPGQLVGMDSADPPSLAWSTISPPVAPPPLAEASAVYDSDNKTIVLFGGVEQDGTLSSDTWVWNGSTWADHPASETQAPPARRLASMAFDPGLHQLILFGGEGSAAQFLGDTWAWNGASWYQQSVPPGNPSPSARAAAAMAYAGGDHLVLFGGTGMTGTAASAALADTWLWTSAGWVAVATTRAADPPARSGASIAFDQTSGQAMLFGGQSASPGPRLLSDLWTFTGEAWSRQASRTSPLPRQQAAMVGDDLTKGLVVFGGKGPAGVLGDTWLWNGRSWSRAPTGPSTGLARTGAAVAFDPASHQLIAFGGMGQGGKVLGDTLAFGQAPLELGTTTSTSAPTTGGAPAGTSSPTHAGSVQPPATGGSATSSAGISATTATGASSGSAPRATRQRLHRGDLVTLRGAGYRPGARITITFQSRPTVVGQAVADPAGRFVATVAVPESAHSGSHRFAATGFNPGGTERQLLTAVTVVGVPTGTSWRQRAALIGAALLIPVATWCALSGFGRWRRRQALTGPGR
jgi:hypothetical protein